MEIYLDGDLEKSFYVLKKKEIEAQIKINEAEQKEIRDQFLLLANEKINLDFIVEYFAAIANFDTEMTFEQQKTLVRALIKCAEVDKNGALNLTCRIRINDDLFQSQTNIQGIETTITHLPRPVRSLFSAYL